jgi:type I restriction enzyme, S subunit
MSETYSFGDLVEKYIDNRGKTPPLSESGVPLLEVKHLPAEGKYPTLQTSKHVSQDVYDTWFRAHLEAGDILFSTVGTTGRVSITPKNTKVAIAQNVLGLRFKSSLFDPAFAFYYLRSKPFQHEIESRLITTVQASIKRSDMVGIPMHLPEIPVQKCIASVLSALDDKIENNRRMNETLEEMARAIFKSWFVHFDPVHAKAAGNSPAHMDAETAALFPSLFGDDGLPAGWSCVPVSEVAQLNKATLKPSEFSEDYIEHYSLPAFDDGAFPAIDFGGEVKSNKTIVPPNSVLLSKLNPNIQRVWLPVFYTSHKTVSSTEFLVLTENGLGTRNFLYSLFCSRAFTVRYEGLVTGTSKSHQRVRPQMLLDMEVTLPTVEIIEAYTKCVDSMFAKILTNRKENQTLTTLRDTLLPKLMSGEIRVADAESEVEAAI